MIKYVDHSSQKYIRNPRSLWYILKYENGHLKTLETTEIGGTDNRTTDRRRSMQRSMYNLQNTAQGQYSINLKMGLKT